MTKYRITFDINADVLTNCTIESTKGCPQCDEGAFHDDLPDHPDGGVGEAFDGEGRARDRKLMG